MVRHIITTSALLIASVAAAEQNEVLTVEDEASPEDRAWDSAASVSILTVDGSLPLSTTMGSLIDRAPGVRLQTHGDADSFAGVSIRGSTMRQVAVHIDGIPLNPDGGQTVNLSEWPIQAFSRVEVYRGNAPSHLGGAAMGGTINMVRDQTFRGSSSSGAVNDHGRFSLDGQTTVKPIISGHPHRVDVHLNAVVNRGRFLYYSDNGTPYNRIDDSRSIREHNRSSTFHALLGWTTEVGPGSLSLVNAWMNKGAELPGHTNNPAQGARLDTQRNLLGIRYDPVISGHKAHAVFWWLNRHQRFDDRLNELGLGDQNIRQSSTNLGFRAHDRFSLTPQLSIGLTGVLTREVAQGVDDVSGETLDTHARTGQTLTADAPISVGKLTVTPVVHSTFAQHKSNHADTSIDPRMGLRYSLNPNFMLRSNGGRYLRSPDSTELFGDRGSMIGNPDLQPERGWQWDVGLRGRSNGNRKASFSVDIGHFWNASRNRITWIQNGQQTMVPINLGKTWVQGLETAIQTQVIQTVFTETNVTWAQSRNLSTDPGIANKRLPSVPHLNAWHSTSIEAWDGRLRFSHIIRHVSANFLDETNWIRTPSRTVQDIIIRGQPGPRWPTMEFGITNVADSIAEVVHANPLDAQSERIVQSITDFAGYPLPGRTFTVGLRWEEEARR